MSDYRRYLRPDDALIAAERRAVVGAVFRVAELATLVLILVRVW